MAAGKDRHFKKQESGGASENLLKCRDTHLDRDAGRVQD
jgi:hypothetical protein